MYKKMVQFEPAIYALSAVFFVCFLHSLFRPVPTGDVQGEPGNLVWVQPIMLQMYMPLIYLQLAMFTALFPTLWRVKRRALPDEGWLNV